MQLLLSCIFAILAFCVSFSASAGDATVTWLHPDQYTDISAAEETQQSFSENLFADLDHYFAELANKLPPRYHWNVTVTDVKLAGEVIASFKSGQKIRVIKPLYPPAIQFEYQLLDPQNKLVSQGKVDLRDMNFMFGPDLMVTRETQSFPYEKSMIKQWFKEQQQNKVFPKN